MQPTLRPFIHQFTGVVLASLVPVILTAFLSIPLSLGAHPGRRARRHRAWTGT